METWRVTALLSELGPPTVETLAAPGSGQAAVGIEHASVMAIFNDYGSDRILRVVDLQINEAVARTTGAATTAWTCSRISALDGGRAVVPVAMDSTTSLPSQVQIVREAGSVTSTGTVRQGIKGQQLGTARAPNLGARWAKGGGFLGALNGCTVLDLFDAAAAGIDPHVLREGEGLALLTSGVAGNPYRVQVRAWVVVAATGDTFLASSVLDLSAGPVPFAVFNGSGSGVVLRVPRVEIEEILTDDAIPLLTVETISGLRDGIDLAPVAMDTGNAALPATVMVRHSAGVVQAGSDGLRGARQRAGGDRPLRRAVLAPLGVGVALASGALNLGQDRRHQVLGGRESAVSQLVLREGEGLAVLQRANASGLGEHEISLTFTVEDVSSGGGSNTYSRARVVNR